MYYVWNHFHCTIRAVQALESVIIFYSFQAYFKLKWTYTLLVYGLNFSFAVVARGISVYVCVCLSLVCICDVRIFFTGYSNNYEQVLSFSFAAIRYMQRVSVFFRIGVPEHK